MLLRMQESMRVLPALTGTNRMSDQDLMLGGYLIPRRTMIWCNLNAMFSSPEIWHQPDEYIPVRHIASPETACTPSACFKSLGRYCGYTADTPCARDVSVQAEAGPVCRSDGRKQGLSMCRTQTARQRRLASASMSALQLTWTPSHTLPSQQQAQRATMSTG